MTTCLLRGSKRGPWQGEQNEENKREKKKYAPLRNLKRRYLLKHAVWHTITVLKGANFISLLSLCHFRWLSISSLSPLTQTQVDSIRFPLPLPHYIIVSKATITVLTHKPLRRSDYLGIMPMISCTQALSQAFAESSKAQSKTPCSDMPRHLAAIFVRMAKLAQSKQHEQSTLLCTFRSQLNTIYQIRVTTALSCYTDEGTVWERQRLKEKYIHPFYPAHTIFITLLPHHHSLSCPLCTIQAC